MTTTMPGLKRVNLDAIIRYSNGLASAEFDRACDGTNPKDLIGSKKLDMTSLPAVAIAHGNHAMMDGAGKYGPYNWRDNPVQAKVYVDAAIRHLLAWFEGEEEAKDSGVHHLGHVIGCMAILLDAQATGNLVDNRPNKGKFNGVLAALNAKVKAKAEGIK